MRWRVRFGHGWVGFQARIAPEDPLGLGGVGAAAAIAPEDPLGLGGVGAVAALAPEDPLGLGLVGAAADPLGLGGVGAAAAGAAMSSATVGSIGARELAAELGQPVPTDEQVAVIEAPLGPGVVIAGAGSGKTETMAARVVWLVANRLAAPDEVLGLTFTRKAAAELGARIRRRLRSWALRCADDVSDPPAVLLAAEPTVLTYAAYAGRLIADHALRIGVEPSTRLLSPAVAWQLADSVVRHHDGPLPHGIGTPPSVAQWVLALSGQLADHLVEIDEVEALTDDLMARIDALPAGSRWITAEYPGDLATFVTALQHRRALLPMVRSFTQAKRTRGTVDFADQMVCAARLAGLPEVQRVERDRYRAVLLDEYQDTGHAQIETLRALFGDGHPVTAVGDPFQSIYGWRGASAGNILRFATTFARPAPGPPATVSTLSTSWRNDVAILDVANAVAAPLRAVSPGTTPLRPRPVAEPGSIMVSVRETVEDEADWVAARLRAAWDEMAAADPGRLRTAAVLVRRRSQIPFLEQALHEHGLPVEIVGLGGLLMTPEVADVVATLQVLADHGSGAALLRLLTGARWRLGPRDLSELARRARELANPDPAARSAPRGTPGAREPGSIVEALDDLGPPTRYSVPGHRRMTALGQELRRLRRRVAAPLPDLVADVERTIGVDVEVAARPDRPGAGRMHLDRFLDEASRFASEADQATLGAFLAYLGAAEDEENGLDSGDIVVESERIQVLTVHGAKGLEWDVVAVPGLVDGVFPAAPRGGDWTRSRHAVPAPLRGDRHDLPNVAVAGAEHRKELADRLARHDEEVKRRQRFEERRLAYVALTRGRRTLLASGYVWDGAKKPRPPSPFLRDIAAVDAVEVDGWAEPVPEAENPRLARARTAPWPYDPLGGRRDTVEAGAALVRLAGEALDEAESVLADPLPGLVDDDDDLVAAWRRDVDALLAERAAASGPGRRVVELPGRLSVSQLVAVRDDPGEFARRLRRPLPVRPAPQARRGTAFHAWLEQRWAGERLLDLDELPGATDEHAAADAVFEQLRSAFEASEWAARTPVEVEVPFETVVAGTVLRGRMDAVFAGSVHDPAAPGWTVVDWKTGAPPAAGRGAAVAVQLAAYRLAWARLSSCPVADVRAAFHYVPTGVTVAPADLLDEAGIAALVTWAGGNTGPDADGGAIRSSRDRRRC